MKDFKSYSKQKQQEGIPQDVAEAAKQLSDVFAGKGEADVLRAIYREAEKGRKAGTLQDSDLDNFFAAVAVIPLAEQYATNNLLMLKTSL